MNRKFSSWWKSGAPWIWLNAAAVAASLSMVVGLLLLIAVNGLGHFWPKSVWDIQYREPDGQTQRLIGEIVDTEKVNSERVQATGKPPSVHVRY